MAVHTLSLGYALELGLFTPRIPGTCIQLQLLGLQHTLGNPCMLSEKCNSVTGLASYMHAVQTKWSGLIIIEAHAVLGANVLLAPGFCLLLRILVLDFYLQCYEKLEEDLDLPCMSKGGIVLEILYAAVFNTELICYLIVIVFIRLCTSKLEVQRLCCATRSRQNVPIEL